MKTHFEQSLQLDIDRIRDNVMTMSGRAEKALRDCLQSYVENNRRLAYAVILRDQYIDEMEKEIDRLCLEFIVRQQPVAGPLRFAFSTIKINLEIERVGDYAESIARHLLKVRTGSIEGIRDGVVEIANLSIGMFHDAIRAYAEQNSELAQKNIEIEGAVDTLRSRLNGALAGLLQAQGISYRDLDALMTIVRRFERVSDQARNICMEVLYMCTGEYAKHPAAGAFRVLFVDDHNRCRSQIAEAVAHSLNQPRFAFDSAGLEPQPIDRNTIDFMKTKGFDLSRTVPRAIHQIPRLDHYQVIVALSPSVYQLFPQRPRKAIFLDWLVEDPSIRQGALEEVEAAYQETFLFIRSQVEDLVNAIIGAENGEEVTQ